MATHAIPECRSGRALAKDKDPERFGLMPGGGEPATAKRSDGGARRAIALA